MKLQVLTIALLCSFAVLHSSQENQPNQAMRTVAQILNDVGTDAKIVTNPLRLQQELADADSADGKEPLWDDRRTTLALACILVRQD